jgi:serine/threonine protein phosphatase PrpC
MYKITFSQVSLIGDRKENEDVERILTNLDENLEPIDKSLSSCNCYIICDGHGGKKVAKYAAESLGHELIKKTCQFPLDIDTINKIYDKIQNNIIKKKIGEETGCTALVVLLYSHNGSLRFQTINIGDCRAVIEKEGRAIPLTVDHKPHWPHEMKRIDNVNKTQKIKRTVEFVDGDYRIGDLSVSRSFGDLDNTPHVTHIPEMKCNKIRNGKFIIMACDGLWDVLQNHEAVNFVLSNNNENIAEELAKLAYKKWEDNDEASDNISVIVIKFN